MSTLEAVSQATYHSKMLLESLFNRFRLALRNRGSKQSRSSLSEQNEDDSFDPDNPFPDVVTIEFRDVIDLHSIPARQVRAVVEDYIEEAHRRGMSYLRIIHGKGIGVQREVVRSVLRKADYVIDFRDAPAEAGAWGATLVTLRVDDAPSDGK